MDGAWGVFVLFAFPLSALAHAFLAWKLVRHAPTLILWRPLVLAAAGGELVFLWTVRAVDGSGVGPSTPLIHGLLLATPLAPAPWRLAGAVGREASAGALGVLAFGWLLVSGLVLPVALLGFVSGGVFLLPGLFLWVPGAAALVELRRLRAREHRPGAWARVRGRFDGLLAIAVVAGLPFLLASRAETRLDRALAQGDVAVATEAARGLRWYAGVVDQRAMLQRIEVSGAGGLGSFYAPRLFRLATGRMPPPEWRAAPYRSFVF